MTVSELHTDRLLLRPWRASDFTAFAEFMGDAEVAKYVAGSPLSHVESWRSMAIMIGHWEMRGYGNWAVERKSDAAFIGRVGPWFPEGWPFLELGWLLGRRYWGEGYATEAANAAMAFMFGRMGLDQVVSMIDPSNTASQAVATRLGEQRGEPAEFTVLGRSFSIEIWSITHARWIERHSPD